MSIAMEIPEEMRKKYLERRQRDAIALSEARSRGDFEPFVKIGHQLKGNAATFGYDDLAELGKRMESAGESCSGEAADHCLNDFRKWILEHATH
jgi:HPt (histidine-containing phosphotransfer) domain-containing protein